MINYKNKYSKYKEKYLNLKNYLGGFTCGFNKDMDVTIYHFTT